jgi:aspartate kinase
MSSENVQEDLDLSGAPNPVAVPADFAGGEPRAVAFKFGGSSLLGAERMRHAAGLVRAAAQTADVTVVVSAMKGVTDRLLTIAGLLNTGAPHAARNAVREANAVAALHRDVLDALGLDAEPLARVAQELVALGRDLLHEAERPRAHQPHDWQTAAHPRRSAELADRLASFGERYSARLFAAALEQAGVAAVPVTSSEFVLTCDTFRDATPDLLETRRRGHEVLMPLLKAGIVPVVTGFLGATPDGRVTTLGRNSSDYSGAIVAHVVDADELIIWTDVDGIYTKNPNESAEAKLLHELSYDEAHALAASGAKVLHAKVLPLAAETEMVVWVRNTFNPQFRGTKIGPSASREEA